MMFVVDLKHLLGVWFPPLYWLIGYQSFLSTWSSIDRRQTAGRRPLCNCVIACALLRRITTGVFVRPNRRRSPFPSLSSHPRRVG